MGITEDMMAGAEGFNAVPFMGGGMEGDLTQLVDAASATARTEILQEQAEQATLERLREDQQEEEQRDRVRAAGFTVPRPHALPINRLAAIHSMMDLKTQTFGAPRLMQENDWAKRNALYREDPLSAEAAKTVGPAPASTAAAEKAIGLDPDTPKPVCRGDGIG